MKSQDYIRCIFIMLLGLVYCGCQSKRAPEKELPPSRNNTQTGILRREFHSSGKKNDSATSSFDKETATSAPLTNTHFSPPLDASAMPQLRKEDADMLADFRAGKNVSVYSKLKDRLPSLIWTGMSRNEIQDRLGPPQNQQQTNSVWMYSLFYSMMLDVHFDDNGKVVKLYSAGITNWK